MKRLFISLLLVTFFVLESLAQWKPAGDRIKTNWAEQINPSEVLPEYPRPIMQRNDWKNLNGLWDYAIIDKGGSIPTDFEGKILVPFAVESSLSGVAKRVTENQEVIYQRSFEIPSSWKGKRILLHFGAVDWKTDVWVNGVKVGSHTGGFTPFSFDITPALIAKGNNSLVVKVWDPTDKGPQPRGKQVNKPAGIWYTPVTGIWQTVWLEPVAGKHIENLRITPDIDRNQLTVKAELNANCASDFGKVVDKVDSYAAMRKYSTRRDANGIVRLELNNEALFQFGPLDQGWWPDGLYTAPTDEALLYDIQKTKDFGFNIIRKHIKVEPARWYTYCDQLGIIVWQDMPSGDRSPQWQNRKYFDGTEMKRSAWKEIMDCLYSYPCIGTWVPFNEAWGQFKTVEIAEWTKQYDPTRLVNPASGGNHYTCGDMLDLHNYPAPEMYLYDAQRATVLGEYGGIGLVLKDHLWEPNRNWGYVQFNSSKEATDEYVKYADMLYQMIDRGFSAAVYTQTTDVEVEVNGLITYDRKVIKLNEKRVKEINARICNSLKK